MSVSSATSRIVYTGNNSLVTAYAVPFYFQLSSHLVVVVTSPAGVETTLAEGTGYVVSGAGNPAGGSLVTTTAWDSTHTLTIFREVPATQLTVYADNDAFPASSHEAALDKLTLLAQQAIRKANTGVRVTEASNPPAPAKAVPYSVAGLDQNGNTVFRTAADMVGFLSLPGAASEFPGATWLNDYERSIKVPDYVGQIGLQRDNAGIYYSTALTAGSWAHIRELRITDDTYPYLQLTNTGAPADKQRLRAFVEPTGLMGLSRINDSEAAGTSLIAWDANNNCGISQFAPLAKLHVGGGAVGSSIGSAAEMFRVDWSNGNASSLRLLQVRHTTGGDWTTTTTRLQHWTDTVPQGFLEFNPAGMNFGLALGTVAGTGMNASVLFVSGAAGGNNVGINTVSTPEKLTLNGNLRLQNSGNKLMFTDPVGTTPYIEMATDGFFQLIGTTSTGSLRYIFRCPMRQDIPTFQFDTTIKIGTNGSPVSAILLTVLSVYAPAAIAANSFEFVDVTLTGVMSNAYIFISPASISNYAVHIRAFYQSANTVRIIFNNPTASSITLAATNYRIMAVQP